MTRSSSYMPFLRGRSGASNQKAFRGKAGWKDYLAAKAKLAGASTIKAGASTIKSATGLGTNRSLTSRIGQLMAWWGLPVANKIANIEMDKDGGRVGRADGGRVKGVGQAKRGFGRAMRKK